MGRSLTFLFTMASAWAQLSGPSPESSLLAEVRGKMLDLLANQPNYTCLETVERTRQAPGGGSQVEDTLRLEVALVDGKEMFAWPGAKQFEDKDIRELVSTGMFGNGNYGIYARMLFNAGGPNFEYRGQVPLFGTELSRYDFRVHVSRSGYHLSVGTNEAVTGFHGSVYLEPGKADLRRLEVVADDIPAQLGLSSSEDRVDYARTWIGDEEFLLPVESALQMASKDSISRNRTRFSGCRKFTGESSLIFDDVDLDTTPQVTAIQEVELPADALMMFEISSDLRLDRAAIGDTVTAVLRSDIKRGKEVVVRKGATAKGRVVMMERTPAMYVLGLAFQELEWKGGHAQVHAKLDGLAGFALAGRPKLSIVADGIIRATVQQRSMHGEVVMFRTVR
jgi:hypothetical protein